MKKVFLLAAGLVMALTACQKEETPLAPGGAGTQTITVSIPQGVQTRAAATDFGNGSKVNRCILQIYRADGEKYGDPIAVGVTGNKATFDLRLVAQQTYDFVFWADCATAGTDGTFSDLHYTTTDLGAIAVNGSYAGNNDEFDAFTGTLDDYKVEGAFTQEVILRRPFGQLNVKTLDLASIPDNATDLKPTKVKVNFTTVPTTFDAKTGTVGTTTASVEYTADILNAMTGELTVDYLWAPVEEATLSDFTMTFLDASNNTISVNSDFKNIPIRRNYRTMVSGNLLTKQGSITVTIDPEFNKPDIVDNPELRAAFANGGSVTLSEDVEIKAPLVVTEGKTVEVNLNGNNIINTTSLPDGQYGNTTVFEVRGGTLNIKGDGEVQAISNESNQDGYRMAVNAYGNSTVNIYGGNFSNDQDFQDHSAQLDLIYAGENATINIYGGTFESKSASTDGRYWVLNLQDRSNAKINVYGGTFVNFNPAKTGTEPSGINDNFVAATSTTVKVSAEPTPKGTYVVVPQGEQVTVPVEVSGAKELTEALNNEAVAKIAVTADMDLSSTTTEFTFTTPKTIDVAESKTLTLGSTLIAQQGLTLTGKGTITNAPAAETPALLSTTVESEEHTHKSLIHVTGGDLVIDGVTLINDPNHHWHGDTYNSAAVAYWNDANVTIRNSRIISGEFTVCGMGRDGANTAKVSLSNSYFESTSSNKDNGQHWAYAMRLFGSEVMIDNCEVKGIQGAVSIEEDAKALISSGKYYTVNSEGNTDAFYPLYISSSAEVTITGGEFYSPNNRAGSLQIEGTSAVVSGDNDKDFPVGSVILKGGKFSGKAYNHVTPAVYEPADGYQWQAITGDGNLKWAVVPAAK